MWHMHSICSIHMYNTCYTCSMHMHAAYVICYIYMHVTHACMHACAYQFNMYITRMHAACVWHAYWYIICTRMHASAYQFNMHVTHAGMHVRGIPIYMHITNACTSMHSSEGNPFVLHSHACAACKAERDPFLCYTHAMRVCNTSQTPLGPLKGI